MIDHDAIAAKVRQDREAGTPGVWDAAIESGCHAIVAAILPDGANIIALIGNSLETPERETMRFANARRIAALPDLEAAYLDLYDEVKRLRAEKDAKQVKRTVPAGQTPLDDKLNHRFLDVIREGEAARDAGTASPYHGHSLEHCLHATGWVSRDLRLALDEARARTEKAEAERDDAISTLDAWFDRRKLGHDAVDQAVLDCAKGYLRTCRVGGMPQEASDAVLAVIGDMAHLAVFADLFIRLDRERLEKAEAERDALRDALANIAVMGFDNDPAVSNAIAKSAVNQARAALKGDTK